MSYLLTYNRNLIDSYAIIYKYTLYFNVIRRFIFRYRNIKQIFNINVNKSKITLPYKYLFKKKKYNNLTFFMNH